MTTSWHFAGSALALLLALGTAAPAAAQDAGADEGAASDEGANPYGGSTGDGDGAAAGPGDGADAAGPDDGAGAAGSTNAGGSGAGATDAGTMANGTTSGTATSGTATSDTTASGAGVGQTSAAGNDTGTMPSGERRPPHHYGAEPPSVDDDDDEAEDEGDPYDFLWIELFGGVSYVDLRAIDTTNYYPESVRLSGTGPAGGAAVGFRIEFFSLGVRGAYAYYDDGFEVGTAVAEVKLHIPIPIVQPYLRVGFGLGWHGDSDTDFENLMPPSTAQTTVFGWAFNGAVGVDIYLAHWFAIGAAVNVDILNMSRQAWEEDPGDPGDVSFEDTGDAVGLQARGQLAVSFHL